MGNHRHGSKGIIRAYIEDGKTIISSAAPAKETSSSAIPLEELDETSQEIVKIIEDYIKPAVVRRGNILFDKYNTKDKSSRLSYKAPAVVALLLPLP